MGHRWTGQGVVVVVGVVVNCGGVGAGSDDGAVVHGVVCGVWCL